MIKNNLILISCFMLAFFVTNSFSGTSVWNKTISLIEMGWAGEGVYVTVEGVFSPVEGCAVSKFMMPSSTPLFKENLSVMLSALHAGAQVGLYVEGCHGDSMYLKAVSVSKN